jgi:hypothetical protein
MSAEMLILAGVVVVFVFSVLGGWVAGEKNRSVGEGIFLGVLFGPFGVLIEALLPTLAAPAAPASPPPVVVSEEKLQRERDEKLQREREDYERQLLRAEWEAEQDYQQAQARKQRRTERRRELWEATPDWAKMIGVGLAVGVVVCVPFFVWTIL